MSDSQKNHDKELKHALKEIDASTKQKCTMCRVVLIFAFTGLLLTVIFIFFFREVPSPKLTPLPPELNPPVDPIVRERQMLELGQLFHPELSTSTTKVQVSTSSIKSLPVKK